MSYQYSNFENTIPVVEKWINKTFSSYIEVGVYEENNIKYNYYILDRDDDNIEVSYILRVKEPLKNYQIYSCGAGGSGGIMYGKGGNGGNYLYINNLNVNPSIKNRQLEIGAYLIIPGKAVDTIKELENDSGEFRGILNQITLNSSFYLIRYDNRFFNNYKNSLQTIDRYKTRDWNKDNTVGDIININNLNLIKNEKIDIFNNITRTIELIFYLKKNKSFRFNEFNNPYYTRLIRISNNNNINTLLIPSIDNNYIYTAGNYDEVISILCFPNGNSIEQLNKIDWTTLFDINYAISPTNKDNYYVYDFNKRNDINKINSLIDSISYTNIKKNTSIYYNSNPDATYKLLEDKIDKYYLGLQGGANGFLLQITTNRYANISTFLKRYYMPYLFSVDNNANLQGGSAGSTFISSSGNIIINKLGGTNFIKLNRINPTNVSYYTNNNEWISGGKGYYNTKFKIYAYYKKDQNIELNNTTLSNGGYSGYWQFIKDEINYKYGATGINDLTSPNYGTYGCGGQGGSVLIDRNSKFSGSKGKDGVFILSFINYAIANIVNNNSSVIKKMASLFITSDYKNTLEYIDDLKNNNEIINSNNNKIISKIINNTFIHEANIHLNDTYIKKLESYINKNNLIQIIAISYIIQRIYYIINSNSKILDELDLSKITVMEILFINDISKEEIIIDNTKLSIIIYDKYNDLSNNKIIGYKYLKQFLEPLNKSNYHELFSLNQLIDNYLNSKKKIIIIKENDILYDMTNDIKTNINEMNQNNFYNFLIKNIAYIFDIPKKDLKINIKVIEKIFQVIRLNSIIYAIFYNSYNQSDYKSNAIINKIYSNLKDYNYDIKKFTDKIELSNNIFIQQNEFKLYFNNKIIEYDKLLDKNIQTANIIKSKKSFMDGKDALKKIINTITIIATIIIIIITIWVLLLLLNISDFNVIPQLFLILVILILSLIIINYYEKYYSYKEHFTDDNNIKQLEIFNSTNDYSNFEVIYNENKYKITFINSNSEFILYKNDNTSIILIQGGEDAIETTKNNSDGAGGTINIYDSDYISNNLEENNKNKITFNSKSIIINDNFKTINRNNLDNKENIKVIYNNDTNTINNNKYTTLKSYYDNLTDNQYVIKEILEILFTYSKNIYYYGSKGNTIINQEDNITKFNYPASYGIGGIYNSKDKTGNNGVMILITKEKEIEEELHTDIQTLINFYNNNINKLIYDNFNNIYLIDNTVIYNNAVNAFKKRLETETDKDKNFRLYGEKINSYSHNILMDVYYKFALVKLFILILIGIIIGLILYYLNKNLWILIFILVIFIILFLVINFIYTTNKTTRMDYYKYYWSKYNNNSY
jgi:hypothetical protein